jgi:RNA polymerase sigma factor (sigma-70 family)
LFKRRVIPVALLARVPHNRADRALASRRTVDHSSLASTSMSLLGRLRQEVPDQAAWSEFVRRYGQQIYRWCRKWNLQEADAQDVTQTVLVKLAQKMRSFQYDPSRSFRAYLKTLTSYAWKDLLESRQRPGTGAGGSDVLTLLESVEARTDLLEHLKEEFDHELLAEAMAQVRQRVEAHTWQAFHLTAVEGCSGAVVAQRLGMKVAAVFKAKSRVQELLQETIRTLEESS